MPSPAKLQAQGLKALVFDAYGTLYDVYSVAAHAESLFPGQGAVLAQLWRLKQLEYTWLRSLMGTYEDFNRVTADALRYALAALKLEADGPQFASLVAQYLSLTPFPEVPAALAQLKAGRQLAILSNGAPDTLNTLVSRSGLAGFFEAVISVDDLGLYKPDMRVYQLAVDRLGVAREHIGFVSSNGWDAAGAATFGFTTFWINRAGAPVEQHARAPHHIIHGLDAIAPLLA